MILICSTIITALCVTACLVAVVEWCRVDTPLRMRQGIMSDLNN
jgi:hypothetical protein